MTARAAATGVGVLLFLSLLATGVMWIGRGMTGPSQGGLLVGVGLGGLNLLVEAFGLVWAFRKNLSATMMVSLGGFFLRLVLVSVLIFAFARTDSIDAVTFALSYVASFFAFLGLQIWVITRVPARAGGSSGNEPEGA